MGSRGRGAFGRGVPPHWPDPLTIGAPGGARDEVWPLGGSRGRHLEGPVSGPGVGRAEGRTPGGNWPLWSAGRGPG